MFIIYGGVFLLNKKNLEQELELELEMELEREEILKKFSVGKEEDEEDIADKVSQGAVKSLIDAFEKDESDFTETQAMLESNFESLDSDFKAKLEEQFDKEYEEEQYDEEDTVLVYNTNANILVLDNMNDITDIDKLSDETLYEEEKVKPSKANRLKKYYMVAVFSILVGFTFVIILLIIYTRQQNTLPSDNNIVASNSSEVNYDGDYVNKLINQNQELSKDVEDLRKEVARLSITSSANVINQQVQQPIDTDAQSVVELPPLENIEEQKKQIEIPVIEQKPPAEQVSKKSQKYTVQKGDTLYSISRKFYGSIRDYQKISSANDLDDDKIKFGDVLIIP